MTAATAHFSRAFFAFLAELDANNNRDWFEDNKQRFIDDVEAPMQQFIMDLGDHLQKISPYLTANPRRVGGSMIRICP